MSAGIPGPLAACGTGSWTDSWTSASKECEQALAGVISAARIDRGGVADDVAGGRPGNCLVTDLRRTARRVGRDAAAPPETGMTGWLTTWRFALRAVRLAPLSGRRAAAGQWVRLVPARRERHTVVGVDSGRFRSDHSGRVTGRPGCLTTVHPPVGITAPACPRSSQLRTGGTPPRRLRPLHGRACQAVTRRTPCLHAGRRGGFGQCGVGRTGSADAVSEGLGVVRCFDVIALGACGAVWCWSR